MTQPNIHRRMRTYLCGLDTPVTYQALAVALELQPPKTIHQVTQALEVLMIEDVTADRPMIATLVISKSGNGLPAIGFFEMASRLGRFQGDQNGPEAARFYRAELAAAVKYWAIEN